MRAHGSLHMHQCSYNSQGYTGRATHLFNLPSHPGSLHSDPTGVQVGHDQAKTLTGDVTGIRAHHNKSRDSRARQLMRFRNLTRPEEKDGDDDGRGSAMAKERSTITNHHPILLERRRKDRSRQESLNFPSTFPAPAVI